MGPNIQGMATLLTNVVALMRAGRHAPRCLVCGRPISDSEKYIRLRGDARAHRECATYSMRRRREGQARLGHPQPGRRFTGR